MKIEEYIADKTEDELKQEYRRIHGKLVKENSAVKSRSDLELNVCMKFIRIALIDLYGVRRGELVALDNKNF